jgi:hypothetical protein
MNDGFDIRPLTVDPKMKTASRIWDTFAIDDVQILIDTDEIDRTSLVEALP